MSIVVAGLLGVLVGVVLAILIAFLPPEGWPWMQRRASPVVDPPPVASGAMAARAVLDNLPTATLVVRDGDDVVFANGAAQAMGVIRGNRLAIASIRELSRATRRDGRVREAEVDLPDGDELSRRPFAIRARAVSVGGDDVVVIIDDLSEARRVDAVRRDFVANISHELKTPVGAISLLAEAICDAGEDREAVEHFAARMQHESHRLARLVQELIDLSRLQGAQPLPNPSRVPLRVVVHEALDRAGLAAAAKHIELRYDESDACVLGDEALLVTAVGNLVDNAIAYSPEGTPVSVAVRRVDDNAELTVSDRGIGIGEEDVDRIFERFYRVDPARSRATGGTGLGLSIVKHIVTNHGGTVAVWSTPGEGSTFTLRLPLADPAQLVADPAVVEEARP